MRFILDNSQKDQNEFTGPGRTSVFYSLEQQQNKFLRSPEAHWTTDHIVYMYHKVQRGVKTLKCSQNKNNCL